MTTPSLANARASSSKLVDPDGDDVVLVAAARRAVQEGLLEAVAAAAVKVIVEPLRSDPHQVGKPLREPLAPLWSARRGEHLVLHRLLDRRLVVEVVSVVHRRHAYDR
ncbi:hypothetical protein [Pseudokineococcus sp. 1T1Z-3]|uniref:hypothetical protein n=1 Tax=Pseudokineococcus sp. 1T1Z-3 TaxID=3132745 RepID=UPI0030A5DD7D